MITRSKKVRLEWKLNPSAFALINKDTIGENTRKLGSSVAVVGKMMERGEEMRFLMPTVLGADPTSTTINWTELVRNYWAGISIDVPPSGMEFEIGFSYDILDTRRKEYIEPLLKSKSSIKTDKDLAEYVEGETDGKPNVSLDERYRYGSPINNENYLHWRFSTFHREVANTFNDVNKSSNIRFYLYSEDEAKAARTIAFSLSKDSMQKYLQLLGNREEVDSILTVLQVDISDMEDIDKDMALKTKVDSSPKEFLAAANDPHLKIKALIEQYIATGILKRLQNTSIIVDASDPATIIGNTVEEAISFFSPSNIKNKATVAEFTARYKGSK